MSIRVRLYVKFRALGFDLARFEKQWKLALIDGKILVSEETVNYPADARVLLDKRGVKLSAWPAD